MSVVLSNWPGVGEPVLMDGRRPLIFRDGSTVLRNVASTRPGTPTEKGPGKKPSHGIISIREYPGLSCGKKEKNQESLYLQQTVEKVTVLPVDGKIRAVIS